MPLDELDRLIRAAVVHEVQAGRPTLVGLEDRVVRRLAHPPARLSVGARIASAIASVRIRPGWAFAGGVAILLIGIALGRLSLPITRPLPASGASLFTVAAPGAKAVAVVGDFSAWQPIALFDHDGDGVWSVTVALPPGRYEYAFVVDGRWVGQDPIADEYVRTFGTYVSVRYVAGGGL
jgi:hypothetical protein